MDKKFLKNITFLMVLFVVLLFSLALVSAQRSTLVGYQEENTYLLGVEKDVDATINGDLFLLSFDSVVQGTINDDLNAVSGNIRVQGVIGDDLRIVASEADINVYVFNELKVISDSLKTSNTTVVGGKTSIRANDAEINGVFQDFVKIRADKLVLLGVFEKDVFLTGRNIVISDDAKFLGNLKVPFGTDVPEGVVLGEVMFKEKVLDIQTPRELFISKLALFLLIAILASFIHLVAGKKINQFVNSSSNKPFLALLIGIAGILLVPILFLISLVTIIAAPIGILLLLLFLALLLLTPALGALLVGRQVLEMIRPRREIRLEILIGTLILVVISFIPGILNLALFLLFALFLGTGVLLILPKRKNKGRGKRK